MGVNYVVQRPCIIEKSRYTTRVVLWHDDYHRGSLMKKEPLPRQERGGLSSTADNGVVAASEIPGSVQVAGGILYMLSVYREASIFSRLTFEVMIIPVKGTIFKRISR